MLLLGPEILGDSAYFSLSGLGSSERSSKIPWFRRPWKLRWVNTFVRISSLIMAGMGGKGFSSSKVGLRAGRVLVMSIDAGAVDDSVGKAACGCAASVTKVTQLSGSRFFPSNTSVIYQAVALLYKLVAALSPLRRTARDARSSIHI